MILFAIASGIAATGGLCWLFFNLAVWALPFFVGLSSFLWACRNDVGPIGAIMIGLASGGLALAAGQLAFAWASRPWIRGAVALLFAVPAALAGYHATHGIVSLGLSSEFWRDAFAVAGAMTVGICACRRLASPSDQAAFMPPGR